MLKTLSTGMATSVYSSLLVKDYQRTKGELEAVRKEIRELAKVALSLQAKGAALEFLVLRRYKIASLDHLAALSTHPRTGLFKHGVLTNLVLECLRNAGGRRVPKDEIVEHLIDRLPGPIERGELTMLQLALQKALKRLVNKGAITRHHPKRTSSRGTWSMPVLATQPSSPGGA